MNSCIYNCVVETFSPFITFILLLFRLTLVSKFENSKDIKANFRKSELNMVKDSTHSLKKNKLVFRKDNLFKFPLNINHSKKFFCNKNWKYIIKWYFNFRKRFFKLEISRSVEVKATNLGIKLSKKLMVSCLSELLFGNLKFYSLLFW